MRQNSPFSVNTNIIETCKVFSHLKHEHKVPYMFMYFLKTKKEKLCLQLVIQ